MHKSTIDYNLTILPTIFLDLFDQNFMTTVPLEHIHLLFTIYMTRKLYRLFPLLHIFAAMTNNVIHSLRIVCPKEITFKET